MEDQLFATCKDNDINLYDFNSGGKAKKVEGKMFLKMLFATWDVTLQDALFFHYEINIIKTTWLLQ